MTTMPFTLNELTSKSLTRNLAARLPDVPAAHRAEGIARALGFRTRAALIARTKDAGRDGEARSFDASKFASYAEAKGATAPVRSVAAAAGQVCLDAYAGLYGRVEGSDGGDAFAHAYAFVSRLQARALASVEASARDFPITNANRLRLACGLGTLPGLPVVEAVVCAAATHAGLSVAFTPWGRALAVEVGSVLRAESATSDAASTEEVHAYMGTASAWSDVVGIALLFGGVDGSEVERGLGVDATTVHGWLDGTVAVEPSSRDATLGALRDLVAARRRPPSGATAGGTVPRLVQVPKFAVLWRKHMKASQTLSRRFWGRPWTSPRIRKIRDRLRFGVGL